ncbi:MAG: helix-turn-helix domain-containing protein [Spirochaetes bacterium]|nr:helix-turn-helix domain-containing protein [Spirochaetota bacterium]
MKKKVHSTPPNVHPVTSEPAEKILTVIEYFAARTAGSYGLNDIHLQTHIPKATLMRILGTLIRRGYVSRSGKSYTGTFSLLMRGTGLSDFFSRAESVMQELLAQTRQSVELLAVRGTELFWQEKYEYPDLPIRIMAKKGFRRSLYELDAPSRTYLNSFTVDDIAARFDTSKFYRTGDNKNVSWNEAKALITAADTVTYDNEGNKNGVRRFAVRITPKGSDACFILAIAEPATLQRDEEKKVAAYRALLIQAKEKLEAG